MEKRPQFFSFDLVCNQNTFEMVVQIILHFGWSHHFEFFACIPPSLAAILPKYSFV